MRPTKFPCRGLAYTLCFLTIAVIIFLIGTVSRFNMPRASSVTVNKLQNLNSNSKPKMVSKGRGYPPVLAYWICGTKGESKKMMRLLKAIYHPRNQYLLQLDDASSDSERLDLAQKVQSHRVFEAFGNVDVIGKSYAINRMGSSALSAILHASALLLKLNADWDWFIPLSASDYPLMTQDDILHGFTSLPRDINFIHFTNKTTIRKDSPLFFAVEIRDNPDAFNMFAGSPWVIFTRAFMEYSVRGWDNLPRKLLMFFTNVAYPTESYFHTLLCNSLLFRNTSLDNPLFFTLWDSDPSESQKLDLSYYDVMLHSGAAFARPFGEDDLILDKIDDLILNRPPEGFVWGQWCSRTHANESAVETGSESEGGDVSLCPISGNIDAVKPGPRGGELRTLLSHVVKIRRHGVGQCRKP